MIPSSPPNYINWGTADFRLNPDTDFGLTEKTVKYNDVFPSNVDVGVIGTVLCPETQSEESYAITTRLFTTTGFNIMVKRIPQQRGGTYSTKLSVSTTDLFYYYIL